MDDDRRDDDSIADDQMGISLPQTNQPLSEPVDLLADEQGVLDDTHPSTDSNIEIAEVYDEGLSGAAEAAEPPIKDAVVAYHPEADRRRQQQAG